LQRLRGNGYFFWKRNTADEQPPHLISAFPVSSTTGHFREESLVYKNLRPHNVTVFAVRMKGARLYHLA
jgi:hypothetical protein